MPVNKVENNINTKGKLVRTSIAGGFVAGGLAGYFKPIIKNGEASDSFVKEISASLKNEDNKFIIRSGELLEFMDFLPNEELTAKELAEASAKGINPSEAQLKKAAFAKNEIVDFLTIHSEEIGILPEENQTLEDAVNEFIGNKNIKEIKASVEKKLSDTINNRPQLDYEEYAKDYFGNVYDKTAKKFKTATEEVTQEQINFIKKAAKNTKIKTGVIYGAITAATAGILTAIFSSAKKKN